MNTWTEDLAQALLMAVSNDKLIAEWGPPAGACCGPALSASASRRQLIAWARSDEPVRRWIVQAWRAEHTALIDVTAPLDIEELARQSAELLKSYEAHDLLLALLTDEHDDGRELADRFVQSLESDGEQRRFRTLLARLTSAPALTPERRARVVIFGGHPRDESKMSRRLFEHSPFDVVWKTCHQPGEAPSKVLTDSLRYADAVIVITSMASHALAERAKRHANVRRIPWRCIGKATDAQLKVALAELFPGTGF